MGGKTVTASLESEPAVTSAKKTSEPEATAADSSVRIVAVGASAGGLGLVRAAYSAGNPLHCTTIFFLKLFNSF